MQFEMGTMKLPQYSKNCILRCHNTSSFLWKNSRLMFYTKISRFTIWKKVVSYDNGNISTQVCRRIWLFRDWHSLKECWDVPIWVISDYFRPAALEYSFCISFLILQGFHYWLIPMKRLISASNVRNVFSSSFMVFIEIDLLL